MKAVDFIYDNCFLSNLGFMIGRIGSANGISSIQNGSPITFHTVSTLYGLKQELISTEYQECLTATFQIFKDPCVYGDDSEITTDELRKFMKWLNQKEYKKFKLVNDDYLDIYFEASFNISKLELNGQICGLELNMFTNRPYALHEPVTIDIANKERNGKHLITSMSDEYGYLYPRIEISILEDGDCTIFNELDNRNTTIKDCIEGERIIVDYPIIESSISSHKIQDAFNWNFFRILNTPYTGKNNITISLPCNITMRYSPIIKLIP